MGEIGSLPSLGVTWRRSRMSEYRYAKGRILESIRFISEELKEFETEYANKTPHEYQGDRRLQKIMDRAVEIILTALIEICGTVLNRRGHIRGELWGCRQEMQQAPWSFRGGAGESV